MSKGNKATGQQELPSVFDTVDEEKLENALEMPVTFPLPKPDEGKHDYDAIGEPYVIATPNSPYGDSMTKLPVKNASGVEGEIIIGNSLAFNMKKQFVIHGLDMKKDGFKGRTFRIWSKKDAKTGFTYYHAEIVE